MGSLSRVGFLDSGQGRGGEEREGDGEKRKSPNFDFLYL
jgi:hypothetical protein